MHMQVVRHERASVKADMWSYGILVWELISNQDITNLQPLAIAQAMQVSHICAASPPPASPCFTLGPWFVLGITTSRFLHRVHQQCILACVP